MAVISRSRSLYPVFKGTYLAEKEKVKAKGAGLKAQGTGLKEQQIG